MRLSILGLAVVLTCSALSAEEGRLDYSEEGNQLVIKCGGRPVVTHVFGDERILRPYFAHVHGPDGTQVTRHHPPRSGIDAVDHDTMHPGIWLAFGDLGGADFWRNKAQVKSTLLSEARIEKGVLSSQRLLNYVADDQVICSDAAEHTLRVLGDGYLLTYYSRFSSKNPFAFGDQEEMGLGVRMATPLAVKGGSGTITNSEGGKNEAEVWGKQADWCDYSGVVEQDGTNRRVGMLLMPHKDNFRRSWFHVRDYGLMVANPFGQNAFTKGEKSGVEVKSGEQFDLRFGVWIYSVNAGTTPDYAAIAKEYHRLADQR